MEKDETKRFNECTNCTDYPFLRPFRLWSLCARTTRGKQQIHQSQIFITMNNSLFRATVHFHSYAFLRLTSVLLVMDKRQIAFLKIFFSPVLSEWRMTFVHQFHRKQGIQRELGEMWQIKRPKRTNSCLNNWSAWKAYRFRFGLEKKRIIFAFHWRSVG